MDAGMPLGFSWRIGSSSFFLIFYSNLKNKAAFEHIPYSARQLGFLGILDFDIGVNSDRYTKKE
jgi:hypothetical protein